MPITRGSAARRLQEASFKSVARPTGMHQHGNEQAQGEPESVEQPQKQEAPQERPLATIRTPVPPGANPKAVQAAAERAQAESQTMGGRMNPANPQTQTTRRLGMRTPLIDVTHMTGDEAKEVLQRILTQRQNQMNFVISKAIRFNNGVEPNIQGGEIVSARDTGSISVYGFARRPLTLYAANGCKWLITCPTSCTSSGRTLTKSTSTLRKDLVTRARISLGRTWKGLWLSSASSRRGSEATMGAGILATTARWEVDPEDSKQRLTG